VTAKLTAYGSWSPNRSSRAVTACCRTAVHAGHLDVVRELIDGRQRVVL
jgi:hypothetical protein